MSLPMMLSSMIDAIVKLSQCNRRKQVPQHTYSRERLLKYAARARCFEENVQDSTSVKNSTDVGEASTTDLSDSSEQVSGSTDGSDTETPAIKLMSSMDLRDGKKPRSERRAPAMPAEWPKAPPGLDVAQPTRLKLQSAIAQDTPQDQGCNTATRLNSSAALFVPSFGSAPVDAGQGNAQQLRQSIQVLKGALDEWEANNPDQYQNDSASTSDSQNLIALQEAISRLSSQDAAVVKAVLQAKEAAPNAMDASMLQSAQLGAMYQGGFGGAVQGFHDPSTAWAVDMSASAGHMAPPGHFYGQQPFFTPGEWGHQGQRPSFTPFQGGSWQNAKKPQAKVRKPEVPGEDSESLATHLRDLAALDSARVLMVRKINHLGGVDVPATLKAYFAKFGVVDRIMMSATRSATKPSRVRPATLGFMVMETAEAVQAILADGADHVVEGVTITVSTFQSHTIDTSDNK